MGKALCLLMMRQTVEMAYDRGMTDDIRFGASIQGGARFFHFLHSKVLE